MDYYEVLEIDSSATDEEIRRAYRRLALRWHPDKCLPEQRSEAEIQFKRIAEAYDCLQDPERRAYYDRYGEIGRSVELSEDMSSSQQRKTFDSAQVSQI